MEIYLPGKPKRRQAKIIQALSIRQGGPQRHFVSQIAGLELHNR